MNPEDRPDLPPFDDLEPEHAGGDAAEFEKSFGRDDDELDADEAGERVEDDLESLQTQLVRLTDERDQIRESLVRTLADFQNFRKRKEQEGVLIKRQATESFALKLIPVLDNFGRALGSLERGASVESVIGGIEAVQRQLNSALESEGVKRIEAVGKPFDPTYHEALGIVESDQYGPETVAEELESGYTLGDKVVRPARVRVTG